MNGEGKMFTNRRSKYSLTSFLIPILISIIVLQGIFLTLTYAGSNITSDGTMGTNVSLAGSVYNIDGGTIRGSNQFHSFGQFSVGTGDTASFNGPSLISNIIGRVTGGQQSVIDGLLKSTISGANLYLLNPSGVLFGSNAALSVSGSFHVSTADYLRMADGARFYADLGKESTLSTAPVAAFGFLSNTPAPITVQDSFLQVPDGKTLSLVGGDILISGGQTGYLYARNGQMNIASVGSPGEVSPSAPGEAPDLKMDSFNKFGTINLTNSACLDVSSSKGNGTIIIRGGRLAVDNSNVVANTLGDANGAKIGIDINVAEDLNVVNGATIMANTLGAGKAGDIRIKAGSLYMNGILQTAD
jgi:filamentous hemagglutinin family protein